MPTKRDSLLLDPDMNAKRELAIDEMMVGTCCRVTFFAIHP